MALVLGDFDCREGPRHIPACRADQFRLISRETCPLTSGKRRHITGQSKRLRELPMAQSDPSREVTHEPNAPSCDRSKPPSDEQDGRTEIRVPDYAVAPYLRRAQAAEYVRARWGLPCACQTLAKLAVIGGGPVFRKAGRYPLYRLEDLDGWAAAKIGHPRTSTSDIPGGAGCGVEP
jgi:hypothetical protein